MTSRRSRTTLAVSVGLLVGVLALFAVALVRAASDDRRDAERRFEDKAQVSAALAESLFAVSGRQGTGQLAADLGGPRIHRDGLDRSLRRGRLAYLAVLRADGTPLAASHGI